MRRRGSYLRGVLEGAARPFGPASGGGIPNRQASPRPGRIRKDLARYRREDPYNSSDSEQPAASRPLKLDNVLTFGGYRNARTTARRGLPQGLGPANFGPILA